MKGLSEVSDSFNLMQNYIDISVCICTYKRPALLARLLNNLQHQYTDGLIKYSIVVVDNDCERSAEPVIEELRKHLSIPITYYNEPEQNIALARNKAVDNAKGDYIAFIDDDEFPDNTWLINLYKTCVKYKADGALGPVKPYFEETPPKWILKSEIFERPSHDTGFILQWYNTRTGNVLLKKSIFDDRNNRFNKILLTGEDRDFFRRNIDKGYVFVWCDEAPAYEIVPPERWNRLFMLKRALFRGKISVSNPSTRKIDIFKSVIASSIYTITLPFLLLIGQHVFMKYLIKTCDHIGRVITFCGIDIIKEKYVTK